MNKTILHTLLGSLLLLGLSACGENENWVIVDEVQPGTYVTGDATAYHGAAPASQLRALAIDEVDPTPEAVPEGVVAIDTWLRGEQPFQITIAKSAEDVRTYGEGEIVNDTERAKVVTLKEGASLQVAKDGLYRLVYSEGAGQLHIIPVTYGVIGAATPGGWDAETTLPSATFTENDLNVTLTGKVVMTKGEYKFRYSGDWGYTLTTGSEEVKFHTNLGGADPAYGGGLTLAKPGGDNIVAPYSGEYQVSVVYNLRSRNYQVEVKLLGEPEPAPEITLPTDMFIIGSINDWNWDNALPMTPVNGMVGPDGDNGVTRYWRIVYLGEGDAIKLNYTRSWDGNEFGFSAATDHAKEYAAVTDDGGNIKVGKAGWYLVEVTTRYSDDKSSLIQEVDLREPRVYLIGDCSATGAWDFDDANLFTIPTTKEDPFISPAMKTSSQLRMAVDMGTDWWKSEFLLRDGTIEYRGNGGDQEPRVPTEEGQVVSLHFTDGTGTQE